MNDPDESFELEIVDDRQDAPHPLDEVSAALDVGAAVDPAESQAEPEVGTAVDPSAPPLEREVSADRVVSADASADQSPVHDDTDAGNGAVRQARLAVDEAPVGSDPAPAPSDPTADVQTLGELLQQARESRGLSVEETSARTRISLKMLSHLENDRFGEFAADAYAKGFLRNYGSFLGLDVDMLVRRYETLSGQAAPVAPAVWEEVVEPRRPRRRWKPKRRTWVGFTVTLVVAALIWVFWSRGAAKLGLRPTAGLQQIENELRAAPRPAPLPLAEPMADLPTVAKEPQAEATTPGAGSEAAPGAEPSPVPSAASVTPVAKPAAKPVVTPKPSTPAPRPSTPPRSLTPKPSTSPTQQQAPKKRATPTDKPRATTPAAKPAPKPKPAPEDTQPPAPKPRATRPVTGDDAKRPPPPPEPADPPGIPDER